MTTRTYLGTDRLLPRRSSWCAKQVVSGMEHNQPSTFAIAESGRPTPSV